MLQHETIEDGKRIRHWSDANFMILQQETGIMYIDAVDVLPCRYTYSETDVPIEDEEIEPEPNTTEE